ncbi:Myblike DNAbinding domain-containing protein [Clydaea vesicula]|uniref:Myblike DNAbinding domain-containing protein n=1 Tax=Clydaea vesicula TaxID=447962 RepID=A0AAD5XY84_9FUNG|nr:Myblike DNAbinding domain-containing protein [Clydaea vesicula]
MGRTYQTCAYRWSMLNVKNIRHNRWTPEEDDLLKEALRNYGKDFFLISLKIPGRTPVQCRRRRDTLVERRSERRRTWTQQELDLLDEGISIYGAQLSSLVNHIKTRQAKSIYSKICTRYRNSSTSWTEKEEKDFCNVMHYYFKKNQQPYWPHVTTMFKTDNHGDELFLKFNKDWTKEDVEEFFERAKQLFSQKKFDKLPEGIRGITDNDKEDLEKFLQIKHPEKSLENIKFMVFMCLSTAWMEYSRELQYHEKRNRISKSKFNASPTQNGSLNPEK